MSKSVMKVNGKLEVISEASVNDLKSIRKVMKEVSSLQKSIKSLKPKMNKGVQKRLSEASSHLDMTSVELLEAIGELDNG